MKVNAVFIPKFKIINGKIGALDNSKRHIVTVFLSIAVVTGVIIFLINKDNLTINNDLTESFTNFLMVLQNRSKSQLFVIFFKNIIPYIFFILLFSSSAIGEILICITAFVGFAGMGAYIAFMYTLFGIAGIKYIFAVYIPGKIIFVTAYLILINICTKISRDYREKNRLPYSEIRGTAIRLALVFLMIILSLFVDIFAVDLFLPLTGILSFLG